MHRLDGFFVCPKSMRLFRSRAPTDLASQGSRHRRPPHLRRSRPVAGVQNPVCKLPQRTDLSPAASVAWIFSDGDPEEAGPNSVAERLSAGPRIGLRSYTPDAIPHRGRAACARGVRPETKPPSSLLIAAGPSDGLGGMESDGLSLDEGSGTLGPTSTKAILLAGGFRSQGFELVRSVFPPEETDAMRVEADQLLLDAGTTCLRHLRRRSPFFHRIALGERLGAILPPGLLPVRSILFDKTPADNWLVSWHQDVTIAVAARVELPGYGPWSIKDDVVHVQPPPELLAKMVTARIHLDDTPPENGALRVMPGSHLHGRLDADAVRRRWREPEMACACGPGDVLFMSPLILHASSRATHPSRRRVVHLEFAPEAALHPALRWAEQG